MHVHLSDKKCVACEGGVPPLSKEEIARYLPEVPGWQVAEDGLSLERKFTFPDFKEAMAFSNRVADLSEAEGHHPVMRVQWGLVALSLSTHAIGGLSENDFILAAKIGRL